MRAPWCWRQSGELLKGPGSVNAEGNIVVNGKIVDPETGLLQSPIEKARQQSALKRVPSPHILIKLASEAVFE